MIRIEPCPYHLHPQEIKRLQQLMKQLSSNFDAFPKDAHHRALQRGFIFLARDTEAEEAVFSMEKLHRIVGMASVYFIPKLGGMSALVEEVVVDVTYRQRGIGMMLMDKIIGLAKERHAVSLELTSAPSRKAAIALYSKIGFRIRETNAFCFPLNPRL